MSILNARSYGGSRNRVSVRWLMWMPVLMASSMLFWTVALCLGAFSLMQVRDLSRSDAPCGGFTSAAEAQPAEDADSITVHLQESMETQDQTQDQTEDVNDNAGAAPEGLAGDPIDDPAAMHVSKSGPGNTAY